MGAINTPRFMILLVVGLCVFVGIASLRTATRLGLLRERGTQEPEAFPSRASPALQARQAPRDGMPSTGTSAEGSASRPERRTAQADGPDNAEDGAVEDPLQYTASALRDPLRSLLAREPAGRPSPDQGSSGGYAVVSPPAPQPPAVTVQGLVWGGGTPQAIIDGQVYGVGEQVQGAIIVVIDDRGVEVEVQGQTFWLRISPPSDSLSALSNHSAGL